MKYENIVGCGLEDRGLIPGRGAEMISLSRPNLHWDRPYTVCTGVSFPVCKAAGAWSQRSPSSSQVKTTWSYASTSLYVLMEWYMV